MPPYLRYLLALQSLDPLGSELGSSSGRPSLNLPTALVCSHISQQPASPLPAVRPSFRGVVGWTQHGLYHPGLALSPGPTTDPLCTLDNYLNLLESLSSTTKWDITAFMRLK